MVSWCCQKNASLDEERETISCGKYDIDNGANCFNFVNAAPV
jgi:hypothetical protein